ncbi:MAG TPA: penicillin acylase family protein [Candidatus Binatia bacterium]
MQPESGRRSFFIPLRCWLRTSGPRYGGEISLSGLKANVQVSWTPHGVPHVKAETLSDLFLAQGYLHAQERLWQMELNRRALCGRAAEIFGDRRLPDDLSAHFRGKTLADLDYFLRLLGMRRAAVASVPLLSDEERAVLESYSAGINRYIETHRKSLPLEFRLLRFEPEPWRPEDTLTLGKGFAFFLSTSLLTRLSWIALAARLKDAPEKLASLLPRYPAGAPSITRAVAGEAEELLRFVSGTFELYGPAAGQGSNSWAVAPQRSATGSAILCNDPHLKLDLPATWYLMHLAAGSDFEVWGGTIPGMPCVHIGRNRRIAWGVTAGLCDDADLYREQLDPSDPAFCVTGAARKPLTIIEEQITVRRGKMLTKKIRLTEHGPLVSDAVPCGVDGSTALAFKWTAHAPSREMRVVYDLNRARGWNDFRAALSHQTAPSLNYIYADRDGNIGYSLAGAVPIRGRRPSYLPRDGGEPADEWKGCIPFEELPFLYNPPEGVIATANNDVAGRDYPYHLSDLFEPPYRIGRIKELLAAKERLSVEDMTRIQQDTVSLHARGILQALRGDLEEIARGDQSLRDAAHLLLDWDADCAIGSNAAALFQCFYHHLSLSLLAPAIGEDLFRAYVESFNQSLAPIEAILSGKRSPWFAETPRSTLVAASLAAAVADLTRRLGRDMSGWRWGDLHRLRLSHPFDDVRVIGRWLSLAPVPTGGDGVTVNLGFFRRSHPYAHTVGASLRMVADLADAERTRFLILPGQSGHFLSPYYNDQLALWRSGKYLPVDSSEPTASDGASLILSPALRHS